MPNPATDDRSMRYLAAALPLNPVIESGRLIALRAKYLRIEQPTPATKQAEYDALLEQRQKMSVHLEALRKNFWKSDIGKIRKSLQSLELDRFPDLRIARDRLRTLAEHRPEFARLAEQGIDDPDFFRSLRLILVAAPRKAATERDDLFESIRSAERLRRIRKMIRSIRKRMPDIYALEADWLESILRMRKRRLSGGSGFSLDFDLGGLGCFFWIIVIIVARIAIQLTF